MKRIRWFFSMSRVDLHFFLIMLVGGFLMVACTPQVQKIREGDTAMLRRFPPGFVLVEDLGNDWMIIDIKGELFIYRSMNPTANMATEVMAPWPGRDPRKAEGK